MKVVAKPYRIVESIIRSVSGSLEHVVLNVFGRNKDEAIEMAKQYLINIGFNEQDILQQTVTSNVFANQIIVKDDEITAEE